MLLMEFTREAAQEAPLFDPSGFDKLIAVAGAEAVINLADVFESQGRERLGRIVTAVEGGDLSALENETHALGSSAGTFGTIRLHILSRAAEAACVAGESEHALSLGKDILAIADESFAKAMAYIATLSAD